MEDEFEEDLVKILDKYNKDYEQFTGHGNRVYREIASYCVDHDEE